MTLIQDFDKNSTMNKHGGKRAGAGRPRGPRKDTATTQIQIRVAPSEKLAIQARAAAIGVGVSEYMKTKALMGKDLRIMREQEERSDETKQYAQFTIPARDLEKYEKAGWVLVYQEEQLAVVRKNIKTSIPAR